MAKHWQMLLLLGFSDWFWAQCDVDRGRPVTSRNVLECANLPLDVPLGGSKPRMENASFKSIKFYISMFSDQPPCMPLCFGTTVIIQLEAAKVFSYFLASAVAAFYSFLASAVGAFSLLF